MNDAIRIIKTEILSKKWATLKLVTLEYLQKDGSWQPQTREAYDRGNGAAILLCNKGQQSVILTRQFRLPAYINGNLTGMLIEVCAGKLDNDSPEVCIKRETEEETGYQIREVRKVMEAYMSPGSVTEILYFFVAEYTANMKINDGGGVAHEHENIEVLEMDFNDAMAKIESGEIRDAKTIMLLQYAKLKNLLQPGNTI